MTATAQLRLVPTSEDERKEAFYAQMRHDNDAKNRLPAEFIYAASEAIALEEEGLTTIHAITGNYEEKTAREKKIAARIEELKAVFGKSAFIATDDSQEDVLNGGKLLKVSVDLDQSALGDNLKPIAQKAIREKIIWMGYATDRDFQEENQGVITMTYPAYNR
ncbi:MAG TPA: hypothetical protein PLF01_02845 [Alphaproteobacteria bacterium]|nr:hypothetical protein [Alphaproteobacteria bacterium]